MDFGWSYRLASKLLVIIFSWLFVGMIFGALLWLLLGLLLLFRDFPGKNIAVQ